MPLRYSKDRLKILKSVAALQQRGALDKDLYREFLRWYGKALRQLISKKKQDVPFMSPRQAGVEAGIYDYPEGYFKNIVRNGPGG